MVREKQRGIIFSHELLSVHYNFPAGRLVKKYNIYFLVFTVNCVIIVNTRIFPLSPITQNSRELLKCKTHSTFFEYIYFQL